MAGHRRNIDPDVFLRERAQMVVDRFEMDPKASSRAIARTSAIGYVGGVVVLGWYGAGIMAQLGEPAWKAWVLPVSPLLAFATQMRQILIPPVHSMSPLAASQRLLWILTAVMMVAMLWLMPTSTPMPVRLSFFAVAIGWTGGISAVYVHLCRKPPKRPRRETAGRLATVKA